MQACYGEFVGTALLVLLGNGVVANVLLSKTKGHGSGWIVIAFGWGMAVFVAVWCVGPISGAHLNPAVTLGLATAGEFDWNNVPGYVAAQMLGAIFGASLVFTFYRSHYDATTDADAKLATFCTAPAIRRLPSNFFSELIGTCVLVLAVLLAAEPSIAWPGPDESRPLANSTAEGTQSVEIGLGSIGALPVGLLVLAIGLSLGGTTGYAINPARDLGPRIAHALLPVPNKRDSDWSYAWVPVLGPVFGAIAAVSFFRLLV
jgi:glycerol uptake facilitator protein